MNSGILKIKILLATVFLHFGINGFSQNYTLEDEKRINGVFKSVDLYLIDKQDPENGALNLEKLLKSENFDIKTYKAEVLYRKAIIELQKRNYLKAINFFNESISEYQKTNNKNRIGKCEKNIGICYLSLNERKNALKFFLSAEKKLIPKELPSLYSNLAGLYSNLGDNKTALQYALKGYTLINKKNNDLGLIEICGVLGFIYTDEKNYNKALEFYNKSLILSKKTNLIIMRRQLMAR